MGYCVNRIYHKQIGTFVQNSHKCKILRMSKKKSWLEEEYRKQQHYDQLLDENQKSSFLEICGIVCFNTTTKK